MSVAHQTSNDCHSLLNSVRRITLPIHLYLRFIYIVSGKAHVKLPYAINTYLHPNAHMLLCRTLSVRDSPSPQVDLYALISSLEHLVVLFLAKKDVRFEQILIEGVHTSSKATLLANPLACLDINYIP